MCVYIHTENIVDISKHKIRCKDICLKNRSSLLSPQCPCPCARCGSSSPCSWPLPPWLHRREETCARRNTGGLPGEETSPSTRLTLRPFFQPFIFIYFPQPRDATVSSMDMGVEQKRIDIAAAKLRASSSFPKKSGSSYKGSSLDLRAGCGVEGPLAAEERIVGGVEATEHAWPWQV